MDRSSLPLMGSLHVGLALVFLVLTVGCGGGGGGGSGASTTDTSPPVITSTRAVLPSEFSFRGGAVTLEADVTDSGGIREVHAIIRTPDGSQAPPVTMALRDRTTYVGTYVAAPNIRSDGRPETYAVVVVATDNATNSAESRGWTFEVPAPDPPPRPL